MRGACYLVVAVTGPSGVMCAVSRPPVSPKYATGVKLFGLLLALPTFYQEKKLLLSIFSRM